MELLKSIKSDLDETPVELREIDYKNIPEEIREEFLLKLLIKVCIESRLQANKPKSFSYSIRNENEDNFDLKPTLQNIIRYCDSPESEERSYIVEEIIDAYEDNDPELDELLSNFFSLFGGNTFKAQCYANLELFCISLKEHAYSSIRKSVYSLPPELTLCGIDVFYKLIFDFSSTEAFSFPRMNDYSLSNERGFVFEKVKYLSMSDFKFRRKDIRLPSPTNRIAMGSMFFGDERERCMGYSSLSLLESKVKQRDAFSISWLLLNSTKTFHGYIDIEDLDNPLAAAATSFMEINLDPLIALSDYEYRRLITTCLSYGAKESAERLCKKGISDGRKLGNVTNILDENINGELKYLNISRDKTEDEKILTDRLNSLCANVIGQVKLDPSHFRPLINFQLGYILTSNLFDVSFKQTCFSDIKKSISEYNPNLIDIASMLSDINWHTLFYPLRSRNSMDKLTDIFSYLLLNDRLGINTNEELDYDKGRLVEAPIQSFNYPTYGAFMVGGTLFLTGSFLWSNVINWLEETEDDVHTISLIALEYDRETSSPFYRKCCIYELNIALGENSEKLLSMAVNSKTSDSFGSDIGDTQSTIYHKAIRACESQWAYVSGIFESNGSIGNFLSKEC